MIVRWSVRVKFLLITGQCLSFIQDLTDYNNPISTLQRGFTPNLYLRSNDQMCISRLSLYHDTHGDACRPVITASTRPLQLALSCYCRIIVPTPPPHKATYPLNTAAQCSLADPCRALSIMCKPTALAFHSGSLQAPPAPCTVLRFLRRLLHAVSSSGAISSYDELSPLIVRCLLGAALSPTCSVLAALPPAPSSRRLLRSRPVLRRLLRAASPALPRLQASCILLCCFYTLCCVSI